MLKPRQEALIRAGDLIKDLGIEPKQKPDPPPIPTDLEFQNPQLSLFQDFLYTRSR